MKTLLQINVTANSGSTGKIAEQIGKCAAENGFRSVIAYGRKSLPSESELIPVGSRKDYLWHGVESRLLDNHGHASRTATKKLLKQIDSLKPDIIHLHNIHGYYLNYPLLFSYLAGRNIPVVWTLHDCWSFTGHCAHFDYARCKKWQSGCRECPQLKSYPKSFFRDRSKQNYCDKKHYFTLPEKMYIVPVSNWLSEITKQSFLGKYPVKTIHNGIEIDVFSPSDTSEIRKKYSLGDKKILLGVASVWEKRKGLPDFIELSKKLSDDYLIVLIGSGIEKLKTLPANILTVPRTESTKELAQFYSLADVLLNPTWEDTYPTVNLESVACGTPVITYQTGGSPESITDDTGIVVKRGDVDALHLAISRVTKQQSVCRQYAVEHFDRNKCFQKYVDLYKEILA